MAMPASGCIGIITCPNSVACTSVAQAVNGNVTPPKSLCALSVTAGKSAPHGMTEFYSFTPTLKYVDFTNISCTGNNTATARACSSVNVSPAMTVGEYYCACFCLCALSDGTYGQFAIVTADRNGGTYCSVNVPAPSTCYCCYSMCVAYGDTVCITTCAKVGIGNIGCANEAHICLFAMKAGGCTNILKGTTRTIQWSYTCGSIV